MDFVEICNVFTIKMIIKAAERIFNSDKICRSYCDFYFGVTFLEHTVYSSATVQNTTMLQKIINSQCYNMMSHFLVLLLENDSLKCNSSVVQKHILIRYGQAALAC